VLVLQADPHTHVLDSFLENGGNLCTCEYKHYIDQVSRPGFSHAWATLGT
jgi:hypothetical protein